MIQIVEQEDEIEKYLNALKDILEKNNPEYIDVSLGSQGESNKVEVMYFKKYDFWAFFGEYNSMYWNAFGLRKPRQRENVSIICQVSIPYEGIDRRIAGAFGKNDSEVIILHRGKIGGGRKGIGKNLFLKHYRGEYISALDGEKVNELAIIGNLNSKNLLQQISIFIQEVDRIKKIGEANQEIDDINDDLLENSFSFIDERFGINNYKRTSEVEAICNHGIIVNKLAKILTAKGYKVGNDRRRDLFTIQNNKIDRIFEIKTDLTNSSIYSAIGQILVYSVEKNLTKNKKILVLPQKLNEATEKNISTIGLSILYYDFEADVVFLEIDKIL